MTFKTQHQTRIIYHDPNIDQTCAKWFDSVDEDIVARLWWEYCNKQKLIGVSTFRIDTVGD